MKFCKLPDITFELLDIKTAAEHLRRHFLVRVEARTQELVQRVDARSLLFLAEIEKMWAMMLKSVRVPELGRIWLLGDGDNGGARGGEAAKATGGSTDEGNAAEESC